MSPSGAVPTGSSRANLSVRPATEADVPFLLAMIKELAVYEREPDAVRATEASLQRFLFGEGFGRGPCAEALVGEIDGQPQGAAIYFMNFSTWSGGVGLYLEDLYVRANARRAGLGRALLAQVASIARSRGCKRLEWAVLDWNEPAKSFYRKLNAREMTGWHTWRMEESGIASLSDS